MANETITASSDHSAPLVVERMNDLPRWLRGNGFRALGNMTGECLREITLLLGYQAECIGVLTQALERAEIDRVMELQRQGFSGLLDDAYKQNLMPVAFSAARAVLRNKPLKTEPLSEPQFRCSNCGEVHFGGFGGNGKRLCRQCAEQSEAFA